ncbi:sulfite exporter TauE/SafE family protein [Lysobacter pythonis]|uniref:Probable membrane transporter protein n=1 Tax=Solilutibacter pythonis TaxID=2483112 RepID=A0A3M2HWL0_9GAMM|nr:sulfite exporter TauE/SafE family protein [Lysobacter pythonis]RMH94121.1 sulfite exporter TauE/SafE family protein [Lysobacter pythonis]
MDIKAFFSRKNTLLAQCVALAVWAWVIFFTGKLPDFVANGFVVPTMLAGSFVAGSTSEGGGAVAFPVMTLFFNIKPAVARDFSLMIQSVGMCCAGYYIYRKGVPVARRLLAVSLAGCFVGQVVAFKFIDGYFLPVVLKISFASIWMGFALVMIPRLKDAGGHYSSDIIARSRVAYLVAFFLAIVGGVVTALIGTGADIIMFSFAVLVLNISEKVATPTSVVLMGLGSLMGVAIKSTLVPGGFSPEALDYWLVGVPAAMIGAPLGARVASRVSRRVIIVLLQISIMIQFVFAWVILPLTLQQKMLSIGLLVSFIMVFHVLSGWGRRARW